MSRTGVSLVVSASGLSLLAINTIVAHVLGRQAALVQPGPVLTGILIVIAILWLTYAVVRAAERIERKIDEAVQDAHARDYAESVGVDLPTRPKTGGGSSGVKGHHRHVWPVN